MTGAAIRDLPLLGLMLGDCTGIGPEQCARVLADRRLADAAPHREGAQQLVEGVVSKHDRRH